MFIKISSTLDKYFFEIGDNNLDAPSSFFSSIQDYGLVPEIPKTFGTFLEAHHYANEIVEKNPSIVLAKKLYFYKKSLNESGIGEDDGEETSINDKIIESYNNQLSLMQKRLKKIKGDEGVRKYKPEEKQKILESFNNEIQKIKSSIETLVSEMDFNENEKDYLGDIYHKLNRMFKKINIFLKKKAPAGNKISIEKNAKDILKAFGESAAYSILQAHPNVYIKNIYKNGDDNNYFITIAEQNEEIIGLRFNEHLLLSDVVPLKNNYCKNIYTEDFLKKYWIPITNSVGHIYINSSRVILIPNYNTNSKKIYGFSCSGKKITAKIDLENEDVGLGIKKSWQIKISQKEKHISDFKEEELIDAEVLCIDVRLPTYYQHSGRVLSVIPRDDYIDLVIDFRRGLDKLVLKDTQIKILNLPS